MLYRSFVQEIQHFGFIRDEASADAALKAAIGSLVSIMEDDSARRLTEELPNPLDFVTLRGNQIGPVLRPFNEAVTALAEQFDIGAGEARELLQKSFHCIKTHVAGTLLDELFRDLPPDWREVIDIA